MSLLAFKTEIYQEIEHNFKISKQEKIFGTTFGPEETQLVLNASLVVSMLISVIWMLSTDVIIEYQNIYYTSPYKGMIVILSLLQMGLTVLYVGGYIWTKAKLAFGRFQNEVHRTQKKKTEEGDEEQISESTEVGEEEHHHEAMQKSTDSDRESSWLVRVLISIVAYPPFSLVAKLPYVDTLLKYMKILFVYDTQQFLVVLIFAAISVMGTFYETKYFTLHLIFIFTRIELLENVFKAIAKNFKQLLYVSLLGIVFVYSFCIVTYRIYGPDLHAEED